MIYSGLIATAKGDFEVDQTGLWCKATARPGAAFVPGPRAYAWGGDAGDGRISRDFSRRDAAARFVQRALQSGGELSFRFRSTEGVRAGASVQYRDQSYLGNFDLTAIARRRSFGLRA